MKRYALFIVTSVILILFTIAPPLVTRIQNEQAHRGYIVSLEFNNTMKLYKNSGFEKSLPKYKESGVTCAVIREERHKIDENKLKIAKDAGLDIALAVYGGQKKPDGYIDYLDKLITKYDVKYIMPKMAKGSSEHPLHLDKLIEKHSLTLLLSENSNQLSNEMPKGITDNIKSADGRIMRSYETLRKPGITVRGNSDSSSLLYYQIINSVRDRNTEFVFVNQITDEGSDPIKSARLTQDAIKKARKWLNSHGYTEGKVPNLSKYYRTSPLANAGGAFLGAIMAIAILNIIFKKSILFIDIMLYVLGIIAFILAFLLPSSLTGLYPSLFALISSCFSFAVCMWISDKVSQKAFTLKVFASAFISLIFCACVLCAMLSGTDYYLNYTIFRGVKLTLLFPMAFSVPAGAIYIFGIKPIGLVDIKNALKENLQKIRLVHIILIAVVLLAAGVYVMRSGNAKISNGENAVRNAIAAFTGARPRTKEFIIGWPALALFAYYSKHSCSKIAKWIFAVASSLIFASVINTFCHVFTDFSISLSRTVNGLIFSIPFIVLVLFLNKAVIKRFFKII